MDSRTEFEKALGVFRRMVATLDGAADLIDSVWSEDNGGSLDAILDLSARVKSALESVGIDVDEWLAEEAALEVIPGTEEAKRIETEVEEAEEGGLVDPTGQNRTGAARWHAAKAGERELDEAEAAANRGDRAGGQEDER